MATSDEQMRAFLRTYHQRFPQTAAGQLSYAPSFTPFHEGGGQADYAPAAMTYQNTGNVVFNRAQQLEPGQANFVLGHELGHVVEPQLVRNRKRADLLLKLMDLKNGRPWLARSVQGRGEIATGPALRRDKWGVPTQGPRGAHSAPNEIYADVVSRYMSGDRTKQLRQLENAKLIPRIRAEFAHGRGRVA